MIMNKLPVVRERDIASLIYFIRGEKVMLDADIARLYKVETRVLKQAVRRNLARFRMILCSSLPKRKLIWWYHKM